MRAGRSLSPVVFSEWRRRRARHTLHPMPPGRRRYSLPRPMPPGTAAVQARRILQRSPARRLALHAAAWSASLLVVLAVVLLAGCSGLSGPAECQSFTVPNAAMAPTYNAGQLVVIDTQAYASARPQRGQVVILNVPSQRGEEEALRVIGLPGETVRLSATQTFINDKLLNEPFVLHRGTQQPMEVKLGSDQYFLMGDNRPQSTDSRAFGAAPLRDIIAEIGTQNCPND